MADLKVALVSVEDRERMAVASAFDSAPASWEVTIHTTPPRDADVVVLGPDVATKDEREGTVVFDPQAPHLAVQAVKELAATRRSRQFVVTGAGRGVGVTTVALHLTAAFARARGACLMDLDVDGGLQARLGFDPTERGPADLPVAAHPVSGGFRVVFAQSRDDDISAFQKECGAAFDRLVIDSPHPLGSSGGIDPALVSGAVLVVPPTPTAMVRARRTYEAHDGVAWATVINRMGAGGETTRTQIERVLGHKIAVELPCCPALRDVEERCRLLSSRWWRYTRRIDALARALERA